VHAVRLAGNVEGATALVPRVRAGGTVVMIALYEDPVTLDVNSLVQKEIRVQGCTAYTSEDFAEGLRLLSSGKVVAAPLITQREPLDNVTGAFNIQLQKDRSTKVLIIPGD
jgi:threonine dehydrogenase-like Zn-dependent dehydrogenase